MRFRNYIQGLITVLFSLLSISIFAQEDTLKVMSYNVLGYGDGCQGAAPQLHHYLKEIISYSKPDILGLVKTASIKTTPDDIYGIAPFGFADTIISQALNAATPDKYAYCPFTNPSHSDVVSLLFFNKQKLGYISTTILTSFITDFNLYKLYYKDPNVANTKDTTFIYVLLNHTKSGDDPSQRNYQINSEMEAIKNRFTHLPNLINMGDFNTHSSLEDCSQKLTSNPDSNFRFSDPPFGIDSLLSYPGLWSQASLVFAPFLTTSTRASATIPNSCGTDGGAKSWYDHIFISPWLANGSDYIQYIPDSYKTIGNDGYRTGISINDNSLHVNSSAPTTVIEALFQFSNKYPVTLNLSVKQNTTGISPQDPEKEPAITGIDNPVKPAHTIRISNPANDKLILFFPDAFQKKQITLTVRNLKGKLIQKETIRINRERMETAWEVTPGLYIISIYDAISGNIVYSSRILKQ